MLNKITIFGVLGLAAAFPGNAMTLTFSDRAQWESQVTELFTFDSGAQTPGTATTFNLAGGLFITELQVFAYNDAANDLTRVSANGAQPWYEWGTGPILRTGDKTASNTVFARITFSTPVSAFGIDYGVGGASGVPGSVTIAPQNLPQEERTSSQQPQWSFYGVISDSIAFEYVDIYINTTNRYLVFDNISTAVYTPPVTGAVETIEPGTWIQLLVGFALLGLANRWRQTRHKAA